MEKPVLVGAVAYDPKVVVIWDIIKGFFGANRCPMDYVFYSNYELQVQALLNGQIDVAWNSPLAWLDAQRQSGGTCRAIAMRDTDRDRVTHLVVRRDRGISSIEKMRGRTFATGASDSPQSTLIPLHVMSRHGLRPGRDFTVRRFDVMVGKHGDHVGGEREALACVERGEADACAVLDLNWESWLLEGSVERGCVESLTTTPPFDHCNFTVRGDWPRDRESAWKEALFLMNYEVPAHREMMDLEGLKAWLPGRTEGYGELEGAVEAFSYFGSRVASLT
jgi:ABC-type phosphate/phosphonate transport system substrate-binding protein